jgi:hypothetical protein
MASAILHLESVCAVAGALVAGTIIALAALARYERPQRPHPAHGRIALGADRGRGRVVDRLRHRRVRVMTPADLYCFTLPWLAIVLLLAAVAGGCVGFVGIALFVRWVRAP